MSKRFLLLILLTIFFSLSVAETTPRPITFTFYPGLEFSYNSISILSGEQETANTLNFLASRLALKVDILDYLSLEVLAGYHSAHNKSGLDFTQLPLSLRWNRSTFSGFLLGLAISSEPLSFNDFALHLRGEFNVPLTQEVEWAIQSPQVSSTFKGKTSFTLLSLDVTLQYQGFTGITIFAGSRLNLVHGKFTASEIITDLQSIQEIPFSQKNLIGPLAGALIEIGDNLELIFKASFLARSEFSLTVFYIF
jgi:hypothetical protein